MKKLIALLALPVMLTFFSCNNQPAETKKEVITQPVIIKEKEPVIVVKDPPEKETEITLDKNGVKVNTKKVNVVIDPKKN
jgi:hypothetical protein